MYQSLTETNETYRRIVTRADGSEIDLEGGIDPAPEEWAEMKAASEAVYRAWRAGEITTDEMARECLNLIADDVDGGAVPWDVADYSELHNFVDANVYTLEVCGLWYPDDDEEAGPGPREGEPDLINAVQTRVSEMLCGSTRPGYWEWRDDFPRQERRLGHKNRAGDLRWYLQDMGRPHADPDWKTRLERTGHAR